MSIKAFACFVFLSILCGCIQPDESGVIMSEYEDGSVKRKHIYPDPTDSSQYIRLVYLSDGRLRDSCRVVNKQLSGMRMTIDTIDGKIYRSNYENGIEQGHTYTYYPNGQLYFQGWNVDGILDGEGLFYEEDGSLLEYNFYTSFYPNKSGYRREYDSDGHYTGFKGSALFQYHLMDSARKCKPLDIQIGLAEPDGCVSSVDQIIWNNGSQYEVISDQRDYEKRILEYRFNFSQSGADTIYIKWKVMDVETLVSDTGTTIVPIVVGN